MIIFPLQIIKKRRFYFLYRLIEYLKILKKTDIGSTEIKNDLKFDESKLRL